MSDKHIAPPSDDLQDVQTAWGTMPRWKARALALGEMQAVLNEHTRADAGVGPQVTPLTDEQKPPRLAADEKQAAEIDPETLQQIEEACDRLDERLTAFEARRDAERKLAELEDALEATGIAPDEDRQIELH
jgi:hypothetical protein